MVFLLFLSFFYLQSLRKWFSCIMIKWEPARNLTGKSMQICMASIDRRHHGFSETYLIIFHIIVDAGNKDVALLLYGFSHRLMIVIAAFDFINAPVRFLLLGYCRNQLIPKCNSLFQIMLTWKQTRSNS